MNHSHDGLTIWFGTPDTPGPFDEEMVPRRGTSLVVAVHPASPTNAVSVRYRVDGGMMRTVPGRELRTEHARSVQYFTVVFPHFVTGDLVEYWPMASCVGRQVPAAHLVDRLRGFFRLEPKALPARASAGGRSAP